MTLCPIALAVGCKKCPAFSVCPLKSVIGVYKKEDVTQQQAGKENPKSIRRNSAGLRTVCPPRSISSQDGELTIGGGRHQDSGSHGD
jgi:hypothetical protein